MQFLLQKCSVPPDVPISSAIFVRKVLLRPKIALTAEKYSYGRYNGFGCITVFYSQFLRFRCFGKNSLSVTHYKIATFYLIHMNLGSEYSGSCMTFRRRVGMAGGGTTNDGCKRNKWLNKVHRQHRLLCTKRLNKGTIMIYSIH